MCFHSVLNVPKSTLFCQSVEPALKCLSLSSRDGSARDLVLKTWHGLGKNGPGRNAREASGDARLAKITPGRDAAFGRRQQNSHSGFAWPVPLRGYEVQGRTGSGV